MTELWDAAQVADFLRLVSKDGKPNGRAVIERVQHSPGFPAPLRLGRHSVWSADAVRRWVEDQLKAA